MTLTQTAQLTKRLILLSIVVLFLGIGGRIGYNLWEDYRLAQLPPTVEKPEMKFGPLPKITFPDPKVSSTNFSYSLDTSTGGFPESLNLIRVYFIPQASISLLSPEKAKVLAENLGFLTSPEVIDDKTHLFKNSDGGTVEINIITLNFSYQKSENAKTYEENFNLQSFSTNKATREFKEFLGKINLLPQELGEGQTKVTISQEKIASPSASISIWPADINKLKIITANPDRSLVGGEFIPKNSPLDFYQVDYTFWPIDKTTYSTYPIKTPLEAFENLKSGGGHISLEPKDPQVSITSVYLAYYQSEIYTPFLQPVFVFEGPNFVGLVPAIKEVEKAN
ncbi:MAG: hypothetical protein Q7S88_00070 [Candidatus Daviesbacteria bacterium]|nr:hypothetical protein [Candidatus Daviesbacteria bacterium]